MMIMVMVMIMITIVLTLLMMMMMITREAGRSAGNDEEKHARPLKWSPANSWLSTATKREGQQKSSSRSPSSP